ncbi:hypothetical protein L198_05933 [Cryptococcus wingfieldii CBS 7118]|uniref:RNase III domain-containing protein n=1 Tax=Cryptococcus wingfieldii CBS 7118 TaxID=1295528 RepID=A0A1E3IS64_9TREE|nr:hypothetical protein L198_05933 [Cryptococcus wingfieldii CBS 7118]ODN91419.1 hypothetical protein L198_05933 [Cryptococcus wingfieldii CBS 7118]
MAPKRHIPTAPEIPDELPDSLPIPPLPEIHDVFLRRQVFTHTSYIAARKKGEDFAKEEFQQDNEKLEFVGDSLLGIIVVCLLQDLYPNLNPGNSTLLKSILVSNQTLAQISRRYGMQDLLITDVSASETLKSGMKTVANIFEAYIAGMFYSYLQHGDVTTDDTRGPKTRGEGITYLEAWLRPLFTPIAEWAVGYITLERKRLKTELAAVDGIMDDQFDDVAVKICASARLNEFFTVKGKGIPEYVYEEAAEKGLWSCTVKARDREGDLHVGQATRGAKKKASQVAAYKILRDIGIV